MNKYAIVSEPIFFQFLDLAVENSKAIELVIADDKKKEISHCFRVVYNTPFNKSNKESTDHFYRVLGRQPPTRKKYSISAGLQRS